MSQAIERFEFIEVGGELTLWIDQPGDPEGLDPVFLISVLDNVGYLRRKPGQVCRFRDIDPKFVERLRETESLTVMEKTEGRIDLIYTADVELYEYDRDTSVVRKALTLFWHKLLRWSDAE